ncbi:MAG TPA: BON domain-containing protein [Candidatus Angelobacter sp.]|nr:BON domain-containing protein [Candidatus Angelobacter sp.]
MKKILSGVLAIALFAGGAIAQSNAVSQSSSGNQKLQDRLSREVHHELVMIPDLTIFDNLAYKVDGGNITLLGQVRNAVIKSQAEARVKNIEGAQSVNNEIEVLPPSPNDDRIRRQVARAIFNDDRLFPYSMGALPPIHIIVKGGHVTLEGQVNTQADKDAAALRANTVPGVFSVENNLRVAKSS